MVEQMKYFSMVGPLAEIDSAVAKYLSRYEIHYENAANRMTRNDGIQPFNEPNPYTELLGRAARLIKGQSAPLNKETEMTGAEADRLINDAFAKLETKDDKIKSLQAEREAIKRYMEQLEGFKSLPVNLSELDKFEYVFHEFGRFNRQQYQRFERMMGHGQDKPEAPNTEVQILEQKIQVINEYIDMMSKFDGLDINLQEISTFNSMEYVFGRLPLNNFKQFEKFCVNDEDVIFQESARNKDYVWGVYFTPSVKRSTVGSIFSSLHFEQIRVSHFFMDKAVQGTPKDIINYWEQRLTKYHAQLKNAKEMVQAEQNAMNLSRFDDSEILFIQAEDDGDYVWGIYFTPVSSKDRVVSFLKTLHFEKISVSNTFMGEVLPGTPGEILNFWQEKLRKVEASESALTTVVFNFTNAELELLNAAYASVKARYDLFEIKRFAAVTNNETYTFLGWLSEDGAKKLLSEAKDSGVSVFVRDNEGEEPLEGEEPPVNLRNPPVIRQFEFFTKMYGVPSYGEFDPTPVLAVVYTILYGLMFGDVGQGICISLLGFYLYKARKMPLGGVMTVLGASACVFGFLYGSVFGLEELIPALWHRPQEDIMGTLVYAVAVGAFIIFTAMVLNIVNAARHKDWGEMFFGPNGVAGLVFYGMVLFTVVRVFLWGQQINLLNILFLILPLVFVAVKEPVSKYLAGERGNAEGGAVMYGMGLVLELVEVLLSYATNTISFIRVGAFAISHAGMMTVVLMLARTANDTHNPLVMVIGNVLVIGIEGFLVGIQVLRLDFYELFSRFYKGGGKVFTPYKPPTNL